MGGTIYAAAPPFPKYLSGLRALFVLNRESSTVGLCHRRTLQRHSLKFTCHGYPLPHQASGPMCTSRETCERVAPQAPLPD